MKLSTVERARYARHISLTEIGEAGQLRLKRASALVVGAGGLGCPVLAYLAAAGVGRLGIVDGDAVELSNLQRQILFGGTLLGRNKADAAAERILDLNSEITAEAIPTKLCVENVKEIIRPYDLVVDGSDNFATRYLLNDACVEVGRALVSAAIFKFQGQLSVFNLERNGVMGPSLRCLYPHPPDPGQAPSCAEAGVVGVLPGVLGALQANEALKIILGIGEVLAGRLLLIDALNLEFSIFKFAANEDIIRRTAVLKQIDYDALGCGAEMHTKVREIAPLALKARLDAGEKIQLVDVRESDEREICHIGGKLVPLSQLPSLLNDIPRQGVVVVYCRSGGRSSRAIERLQSDHGYSNLVNLEGGILRWIDEVDPSLSRY